MIIWSPVVAVSSGLALLTFLGLPCWTSGQITWDTVGWGVAMELPELNSAAYFALLRADYKFREQPEYVHYTVDIRINPCQDFVRTGELGERCCQFTNRNACQDVPEVDAGEDMLIAYFQNAHIVSCRGTAFRNDPNCGTYIEVHKGSGPDRLQVLADVRIDATALPNGYQTTRVATYTLCLGDHELWWVVRTRAGPFVQKIKKFQVLSPTCASPPGAIPAPVSYVGFVDR